MNQGTPQRPTYDEVQTAVQSAYNTNHRLGALLPSQTVTLKYTIGDITELYGKRILDIACGSIEPEMGVVREPWLCRAAAAAGALQVVGVDKGDNGPLTLPAYDPDAAFQFLKRDLINPHDALKAIPDGIFDVATCANFYDQDNPMANSPRLKDETHNMDTLMNYVQRHIKVEVLRLLVPGGIFIRNSQVFVKTAAGWDGPIHVKDYPQYKKAHS